MTFQRHIERPDRFRHRRLPSKRWIMATRAAHVLCLRQAGVKEQHLAECRDLRTVRRGFREKQMIWAAELLPLGVAQTYVRGGKLVTAEHSKSPTSPALTCLSRGFRDKDSGTCIPWKPNLKHSL